MGRKKQWDDLKNQDLLNISDCLYIKEIKSISVKINNLFNIKSKIVEL